MDNKIKVVGLGSVVVVILFIGLFFTAFSDKEGPVITIDNSKELVYQEGDDESILLQGVSATDKKDGDVSETLRIDNILVDGNVVKVKYAAKDSHNNVTITDSYRVIKYISITSEEEEPIEESDDTDSSSNNELNDKQTDEDEANLTDPTVEIDKESADKSGIPVITLTEKEVTIHEGESFSDITALGYVKETYDNSGDVSRRIRVTGNEEELKEGDYEIKFTVSDTDGNVSEPAILTLHVEANE